MAPLTVSVPVLGALAARHPLGGNDALALALLGLCAHVFGFAANDLIDQPVDHLNPDRRNHPLHTGAISSRWGWLLALIPVPLAFAIYRFWLDGDVTGMALLAASVALSLVYNRWSKRGRLPRLLSELSLAASVGLLALSGGLLYSGGLSISALFFSIGLALVLLLVNSLAGGLKDLKTDQAAGATSFVLAAGCRMLGDDELVIAPRVRVYGATVQLAIWLCLAILIGLLNPDWWLIILIALLGMYGGLHLRLLLAMRSFDQLRQALPLLGGYFNYCALALTVMAWMPLILKIGYGVLAVLLLMVPLRAAIRIWQAHYSPY